MSEDYYQLDKGVYTESEPTEYYKFKYEADNFQKWGFKAIEESHNILVTAHTGAGKTALAIYAIAKWLFTSQAQIIYCSPIKALSNQKYKEFLELFDDKDSDGEISSSNIGILTGDVKVNPNARVVIMTAEILRNSLLQSKKVNESYDFSFNSNNVKCVILDEVHFINNPERGRVWEEIITNLNPDIQLVMLSATINGAENLSKWVGNIKKVKCHLIPTQFRPVPLNHYLYDYADYEVGKDPLKCISKGYSNNLENKNESGWIEGEWSSIFRNIKNYEKKKQKFKKLDLILNDCIEYCRNRDMLPINIFILSREHLETIADSLVLQLVDHEEVSLINKIWNQYLLKYRDVYQHSNQWQLVLKLVNKGIGIHHSGIIPILKEMVEILYENKLIKVLFATETFAMGVNMPTRTVIFHKPTKHDGRQKRFLNPAEYIQMAGRAGRRGLDDFGNVIILPDKSISHEEDAKRMIKSEPQVLKSKFCIDYSFVLKRIVMMHDLEERGALNFIANNISESLFSIEENLLNKSYLISLKEKLLKIKDQLNDMNSNHSMKFLISIINESPEITDYCLEIENEEKKMKWLVDNNFTIKQGDKKKYEKKINGLKENIYSKLSSNESDFKTNPSNFKDSIDKLIKLSSEKKQINDNSKKIEEEIEVLESYNMNSTDPENNNPNFILQLELVCKYLHKFRIIDMNPMDSNDSIVIENDYLLTNLGRVVAEVNECNPLLIGYIIDNDLLINYEFHDIASILSIFIADKHEESPSVVRLDANFLMKDTLQDIESYIEDLESEESILMNKLPYTFRSNWNYSYSAFEIINIWAKGECKWGEVKNMWHKYFSFEGNFCNIILRLSNLFQNIEAIAINTEKVELVKKINGYSEKLIRDIVTTDSLYI